MGVPKRAGVTRLIPSGSVSSLGEEGTGVWHGVMARLCGGSMSSSASISHASSRSVM